MLILGRKVGETLNIGDNITVTVLSVKGNSVRLGVNAPKDVVVDREEIHERRVAEMKEESISDSNVKRSTSEVTSAILAAGK